MVRSIPRLMVCTALLVSCSDTQGASDAGVSRTLEVLTPPGQDIGLSPGSLATLRVRYRGAGGNALTGATVSFAIFGDPRGSSLSADISGTDADGVARVSLRAGAVASRFQVRATAAGGAAAVFYIEVSDAGFGALAVTGSYAGALDVDQLTKIGYHLYGNISCDSVSPTIPPPHLRRRQTGDVDVVAPFRALPLDLSHTLLGLAYRYKGTGSIQGWQLRATGCVEIPVGVLKAGQELSMSLPLTDLLPTLGSTYRLGSKFALPKQNRPLAEALAPWLDLVDCKHDPVQRLLDCTVDALDAGDPLDCTIVQPSPAAQAILAERGALSGACRQDVTPRGTPALEAELAKARSAAAAPFDAALRKVPSATLAAMQDLRLESTLEIHAVDSAGAVLASHALRWIAFHDLSGGKASYQVPSVGLPVWRASPVTGSIDPASWKLALGQHGFGLRFGALARQTMSKLVLIPAGLPAGGGDVAKAIVGHIEHQQGGTKLKGCAAMEALVCKAARLGPGCLGPACGSGVTALAKLVDGGFSRIDGQHTDLILEGEALLRDKNVDMVVDGIGDTTAPGTWKARFRLGQHELTPTAATFHGNPQK